MTEALRSLAADRGVLTPTLVALLALLAVIGLATLAAQEPRRAVAHCATPSRGVDTAEVCDSLTEALPVAIQFQTEAAQIPFTRTDVETIYLDALVRVLPKSVRADSAWAFAHRDTSHIWADVELLSERRLRVEMLYWSWQPDETISRLCHVGDTLEVVLGSAPALGAALGAEVQVLARCAERQERLIDPAWADPPAPVSRGFRTVLLFPIAFVTGGVAFLVWLYARRRRPEFWQVAARYPDKAYDWFVNHDEWVVVDPEAGRPAKPDEGEFEGPFIVWVPKLGGRQVAVYGEREAMKESQRAFLRVHGLGFRGAYT